MTPRMFGLTARRLRRLYLAASGVLLAGALVSGLIWGRRHAIDRRIERYRPLIQRHAAAAGVPAGLVEAVVRAESGGDARAVSRANARGLMQVTAIAQQEVQRRFGPDGEGDLFDPDCNLRVGTRYLRLMIDQFGGDLRLALAAYNMGPTALGRLRGAYPGMPPRELIQRHAPAETAGYVRKVLGTP